VSAGRSFRVATWNVRAAIGPGEPFPPAWWRHVDPGRLDRIAGIIAALDADVVALQEVSVFTVEGRLLDQPAELARLTGTEVRYAAVHAFTLVEPETGRAIGSAQWGNALLSRGSFLETFADGLPVGADDEAVEPADSGRPLAGIAFADAPYGTREPRCVIGGRVVIDGAPIRILNAHFAYAGTSQRQRQAEAMAAHALAGSEPVVVIGDFNAAIDSPELAGLARSFDDAFEVVGILPADPRRRSSGPNPIDHLLSRGFDVVDCRVVTEAGDASDHLPVVVTFEHRRTA
jgi:endonuclease/exonuclease/phosphatase family metal-dependent hydrolase